MMIYYKRSNYLAHHGILGQKWGIRRFQNPDGSLTDAGKKRYNITGTSGTKSTNAEKILSDKVLSQNVSKIDDKNHRLEDIGIIAAAYGASAGLLALSITPAYVAPQGVAYGVVGMGVATAMTAMEISAIIKENKAKKRIANAEIDKKTGLPLKNKKTTAEEDLKEVNPGYGLVSDNTKKNCVLCSVAFELRRRGYDVVAKKSLTGFPAKEYSKWFKNAKMVDYKEPVKISDYYNMQVSEEDVAKMQKWIKSSMTKQGNGARGMFHVVWAGGGGHAMAYAIENNDVIIYDAQSGRVEKLDDILSHSVSSGYMRLDNCEIDIKKMREVGVI